jgi:hypothetical protein
LKDHTVQFANPISAPPPESINIQNSVAVFSVELLQFSFDIASYCWLDITQQNYNIFRSSLPAIGKSWSILSSLFGPFSPQCSGNGKEKVSQLKKTTNYAVSARATAN